MRERSPAGAPEAGSRPSEERFKAAAESIPDGLAIFDAEDRFVFVNSRYPQHLRPRWRSALRLGIRFEDWLREGLADGPVYHPDMGEGFLERRLPLHREGARSTSRSSATAAGCGCARRGCATAAACS